jgi:hypothetical protein
MIYQEVFDKIVSSMVLQGKPSKENDYSKYRFICGDLTLKCSVGQIIPDHLYSIELEGHSVEFLPNDLLLYLMPGEILSDIKKFLIEFQYAHDEYVPENKSFVDEFILRSNIIAAKLNLRPYSISGYSGSGSDIASRS